MNRKNLRSKKVNGSRDPFVSVIIPVYNGARYLEQAVKSVRKSTYKNFEIILVDDGSLDSSRILGRNLAEKYPNITFYGFSKNRGLGRVLNFALTKAKGTYICRLNQDDEMYPTRLAKQVTFLETHPDVTLVGSWLLVEDENGERSVNKFLEHDSDIRKTWLTLSPCWDAAVMYRKDDAIQAGFYEQSFWPADDLHMWYRLGSMGKIANIQEPLVKIRFHTHAVSMSHHRKHMIQTYRVHRWAHNNITKASIGVQFYWLGQLIAGHIFSARFNWHMYRCIKRWIFISALSNKPVYDYTTKSLVHLSYGVFPSYSS